MKKNDSLPFMLLISLMTALIGISGCAAAEKASQTKAEAVQMGVEAAQEDVEIGQTSVEAAQIGVEAAQAEAEAAPADTEAAQAEEEAATTEFTVLDDYQKWAKEVGYPQGMLAAMGVDGINQDYFHTLPDAPGYRSGKIVIGDSRCCQLGIYEQRTGADDFADYAVWGGHFLPGAEPPAMTEEQFSEVERCFQEQIKSCGECSIYFFATVNDYDYIGNENDQSISAAVSTAEKLGNMSCQKEGKLYRPEVIVIGFDGGAGDVLQRIPAQVFNRYVDDYNEKLRTAVNDSPLLQQNAEYFTTVPEITDGSTGFNEDGLHYSDDTLSEIVDYILEH